MYSSSTHYTMRRDAAAVVQQRKCCLHPIPLMDCINLALCQDHMALEHHSGYPQYVVIYKQ